MFEPMVLVLHPDDVEGMRPLFPVIDIYPSLRIPVQDLAVRLVFTDPPTPADEPAPCGPPPTR